MNSVIRSVLQRRQEEIDSLVSELQAERRIIDRELAAAGIDAAGDAGIDSEPRTKKRNKPHWSQTPEGREIMRQNGAKRKGKRKKKAK